MWHLRHIGSSPRKPQSHCIGDPAGLPFLVPPCQRSHCASFTERNWRLSEGRSFQSHGTGSQCSWWAGARGEATTHMGRCCSCWEALPPLRLGPHTSGRSPTPAAWQTLLSETKPRACHPWEDATAAHKSAGRHPECSFQKDGFSKKRGRCHGLQTLDVRSWN